MSNLAADIKELEDLVSFEELSTNLDNPALALILSRLTRDIQEAKYICVQKGKKIDSLEEELTRTKKTLAQEVEIRKKSELYKIHLDSLAMKWYPEGAESGEERWAWDKTECAKFVFGPKYAKKDKLDNYKKKWPKFKKDEKGNYLLTDIEKQLYCLFEYEKPAGHTYVTLPEMVLVELRGCLRKKDVRI